VTLTFDLENLWCIACDVMKLCAKFEGSRAIRSRVIAISVFDLMTLKMCVKYVMRSALGYFSPSLTFDNLLMPEVVFFDAHTLCHAVTLTLGKVRGTSSVR